MNSRWATPRVETQSGAAVRSWQNLTSIESNSLEGTSMKRKLTWLLVFAAGSCARAQEDHVALAKAAERSMHQAVDAWAAAKAEGKPTAQASADIQRFYFAFIEHVLKTPYIPNAAVIVPNEIASAGLLKVGDREMSYFAGGGQSGIVMSGFERAEWTRDHLPSHGFLCSLGIEPRELQKSFKVASGEWADADQRVLRLHYVLDDTPGVIEARRGAEGWSLHPDRGVVGPGNWWRPHAGASTTQPTP
jgi:hypothetical protein